MGKHGPAGCFLDVVRQRFKQEPEQLSLLAHYSLENQILLTCCVPPLSSDRYQPYSEAVRRWVTLLHRRQKHPRRAIQEDMVECLAIHRALLTYAETVRYPTSLHLLAMLKASQATPHQPWKTVWQAYLLQTLRGVTASSCVSYQEIALLWDALFPEKREQKLLQEQLFADYTQNTSLSRRFIATLCNNLRDLRDFQAQQNPQYWSMWRDWRYLHNLRDLREVREWRYWQDWQDWQNTFLLAMVGETAIQSLPSAQESEKIDLFTILLGRLLYIQLTNKPGLVSEERKEQKGEIERIVTVAWEELTRTNETQYELSTVLLDILRYQPVRTGEEVSFVQQLAEKTTDQKNATSDC